jgi:hypothetical protein
MLPAALLAPYPSALRLPFLPAPRLERANLVANSEKAGLWAGRGFRLVGRVAAPPQATNAEADCLELAPAPHSYATPSAEVALAPGVYEVTGSLYLRSYAPSADGRQVHLQAGGFAVHSPPSGHTLTSDWQRVTHSNLVTVDSSSTLLLLLVNHDVTRPLAVCVTGAQLELGGETTPYLSALEGISRQRRGGLDRAVTALVVLGAAGLSVLAVGGWRALWQAATRTGLIQGLSPLALALGGWALAQRWGLFFPALERATGFTFHPNVFGGQLAVLGLLALATARSWPLRLMAVAGAAAGILATGSRGALLAYLLGVALWAATAKPRSSRLLLTATLITVALITVALTVAAALALTFGSLEPLDRLQFGVAGRTRTEVYAASWQLIGASPVFGWGLGSASDQLLRVLWDSNPQTYAHAHNLVLQFGLEFGLVGLAGLGLALYLLLRTLLAHRARHALPALAALFVSNLFDYTLGAPELYVLALVLVGAAMTRPALSR